MSGGRGTILVLVYLTGLVNWTGPSTLGNGQAGTGAESFHLLQVFLPLCDSNNHYSRRKMMLNIKFNLEEGPLERTYLCRGVVRGLDEALPSHSKMFAFKLIFSPLLLTPVDNFESKDVVCLLFFVFSSCLHASLSATLVRNRHRPLSFQLVKRRPWLGRC